MRRELFSRLWLLKNHCAGHLLPFAAAPHRFATASSSFYLNRVGFASLADGVCTRARKRQKLFSFISRVRHARAFYVALAHTFPLRRGDPITRPGNDN